MTNRQSPTRRTFMQWTGSLPLLGALPKTVLAQAGERPAASGAQPAGSARPSRFAYVGTYTFNAPGGTAGGPAARGIYVFAPRGDAWTQVQVVESANPSFLAVHPNQRFLYAINELEVYEGRPNGSAEAYAIDPHDGKLTLLNRQPLSLSGTNPAHVMVSPDGRCLCVSIYSGGAYNLLPIGEDGKLGTVSGIFKDTGSGPRPEQEAPHAHMMLFDTTGQHVIGTDLGTDRINVFAIEGGKLAPRDRAQLKPGSGPRHLALHPQGKLLYVINELDGSVACHGYDPATGHVLEERQRISTTPADYTGQKSGAEVLMHPSGRFLYASNRKLKSDHPLADSVAAFSIDALGKLTPLQYWNEGVHFPRAMTMAPDGSHLYVLNQKGDTILRLRIDGQTGKLDQPTVVAKVPTPVCLVFAA